MSLQIVEQLMHHYLAQHANLCNNNETDSANYQFYLQNQIKSTQTHIIVSLNERYGPENQIIRRETQARTVPVCPYVYEDLRFTSQINLSKQLMKCIDVANSTVQVQCIPQVDSKQVQKSTEISQKKHVIHRYQPKKQKAFRRQQQRLNGQTQSQANPHTQIIDQQSRKLNQAGIIFQQIIRSLFGENC